MKSNPLVSILIPSYNRAGYLPDAIDSALSQTYPNLEIIVHDDASTDHTLEVLKKYRSNQKVKIIHTRTNHGMIGGWNYLVGKANGKYLKFLASDDLLSSDCVAKLVRALEHNPQAALATCCRQLIDEKGATIKTLGFAKKNMVVNGRAHVRWVLNTVRENKIGEPTAVLYRTSLVKQAGAYDPTFSQFADFEYWLRLLQFGDLVYLNQSLCSFRQHQGSSTTAAIRDGRFITEVFALIAKYYHNPQYVKAFKLNGQSEAKVKRQKTLDILKNIKDLFVDGHLSQARNYYRRLSSEVSLDYMTRATLSYILRA